MHILPKDYRPFSRTIVLFGRLRLFWSASPLSSGDRLCLDKVVLHVTLQVEEGKFVIRTNLQEGRELGIGVDDSAIGLVLKVVGADVIIDLTAHLGSSHLGTSGLAQKGGKFITDQSGLDESRGLTVSRGTLGTLSLGLLGEFLVSRNRLAKSLEIRLEGGQDRTNLLDLSIHLIQLGLGRDHLNL